MKAVNLDEVIKILRKYGKYIFVTDEKKYSSMVDEIANLKALEQEPYNDWYDVPSAEMTLEQARRAVKDLRKKLAEYLEQEPCDVFDEYGNYKYPSDVELTEPNTATSMPCEDAISRSDMLDAIGHGTTYTSEELQRIIQTLSPVNPQPKTGHWIDIMVGDMPAQACDQCNTFYPLAYTGGGHKYCPNCGAKMIEPQETETWNGYHGQITAPKGTFERIFNDADDENDI